MPARPILRNEKKRPHHDLPSIQAEFAEHGIEDRITGSALTNARALGMTSADIIAMVQALTASLFYKSMTSDRNNRVWQDVYHTSWEDTALYVKFTTDEDGYVLLSLKVR